MLLVGPIVRLQVQRSSVKIAGAHGRRYHPGPLVAVPALRLDRAGVTGLTQDGDPVLDVHHRDHPASKNRELHNGISLGFTGHYAAMRDQFGAHLSDGIAGENILIQFGDLIGEADLARGLVIATQDGTHIALERIFVAAPCVEFSRYALRFPDAARPDRRITAALQFLDDGMRGYYATYDGAGATVRLGDRVYVP